MEEGVVTQKMVREWARATGRAVGERGRVQNSLMNEYLRCGGSLEVPAPAEETE